MKKIIALMLAAALALSVFAACGKQETTALPDATYEEEENATTYRGYEYAVTLTCNISYTLYMDVDGNVVDQKYVSDTSGELAVTEIADPKLELTGMTLTEAAAKFTAELVNLKLLENDGYVFVTVLECYNEKVDVYTTAADCVEAVTNAAKDAGVTVRVEKAISDAAILTEEEPDVGDVTDADTDEEEISYGDDIVEGTVTATEG